MAFQVDFTPSAQRNINRLPESVAFAIYEFAHGVIAQSPLRVGKPLNGVYKGAFAARRGEYRVLYYLDLELKRVEIFRVHHRRDAYFRN